MTISKKKENHLLITLEKKEYITIYVPNKNIRLLVENNKNKLNIIHLENKKV